MKSNKRPQGQLSSGIASPSGNEKQDGDNTYGPTLSLHTIPQGRRQMANPPRFFQENQKSFSESHNNTPPTRGEFSPSPIESRRITRITGYVDEHEEPRFSDPGNRSACQGAEIRIAGSRKLSSQRQVAREIVLSGTSVISPPKEAFIATRDTLPLGYQTCYQTRTFCAHFGFSTPYKKSRLHTSPFPRYTFPRYTAFSAYSLSLCYAQIT
jgi:hypothetical protein